MKIFVVGYVVTRCIACYCYIIWQIVMKLMCVYIMEKFCEDFRDGVRLF